MKTPNLVRDLRRRVRKGYVQDDAQINRTFGFEPTGRFTYDGSIDVVVHPGTVGELAAVLGYLGDNGRLIPNIPVAGGTGSVGGQVPRRGAPAPVIISVDRLNWIGEPSPTGLITVGAGVPLYRLDEVCPPGYAFGLDIGSKGAAMVGGAGGTNAGGRLGLRYRRMRDQLRGVTFVLPTGQVVKHLAEVPGLPPNLGDLAKVVVGSEGTLGIIAEAQVQYVRARPKRAVAILAVKSVEDAVSIARELRPNPSCTALEFMLGDSMEFVCRARSRSLPTVPAPAYLLVELSADTDPSAELEAFIGLQHGLGRVIDAAVSEDLWWVREAFPLVCNELSREDSPVLKLDVRVPLARYAEFANGLGAVVAAEAPNARAVLFGHLGQDNGHANILDTGPALEAVERAVLDFVEILGGNTSDEHGKGVSIKRAYWWRSLTHAEQQECLQIKWAFDRHGLANPGCKLPV